MKKIRKYIGRMVLILTGAVLVVSIYAFAARALSGESPAVFGFRQAIAVSGSMEPLFSAGDLIIYEERHSYQTGDVILFCKGGSLITHRITGEKDGQYQTKGDANNVADEELTAPDEIRGELVWIIPKVGNVILFLKTPLGILLLLGSGLIIMYMPMRERRTKWKRN